MIGNAEGKMKLKSLKKSHGRPAWRAVGMLVLGYLAVPSFCQSVEIEAAASKIKLLESEKATLEERLRAIEKEIQLANAAVVGNGARAVSWEIEIDTMDVEVLQAPYDFATPVRIGVRPWKLEPGQRIAVVGAVDNGLNGFWQVADNQRKGYVRNLLVKVYRNGEPIDYLEKDNAIKELAPSTRAQLGKDLLGKSFVVFGVFPDGPNSAGGVGVSVVYRLLGSSKTAKYITFTVTPFNAVGDMVVDRISGSSQRKLKATGPIDPRPIEAGTYDEVASWDPIWYNSTIYCLRLDRVDIEYMDGSKSVLIADLKAAIYPEFTNSCRVR